VTVLGILLGFGLGLAAGGRLDNLLDVRLRWWPVLLVAAGARFGLDAALRMRFGCGWCSSPTCC
jgi:hypothetical protein